MVKTKTRSKNSSTVETRTSVEGSLAIICSRDSRRMSHLVASFFKEGKRGQPTFESHHDHHARIAASSDGVSVVIHPTTRCELGIDLNTKARSLR